MLVVLISVINFFNDFIVGGECVCYCDVTVCIIVDHLMQGPVLKGAIKKKIKYPCVCVCERESDWVGEELSW